MHSLNASPSSEHSKRRTAESLEKLNARVVARDEGGGPAVDHRLGRNGVDLPDVGDLGALVAGAVDRLDRERVLAVGKAVQHLRRRACRISAAVETALEARVRVG